MVKINKWAWKGQDGLQNVKLGKRNHYKNINRNFKESVGNRKFKARKIRKWVVLESMWKEEIFGGYHLDFGHTIENIAI